MMPDYMRFLVRARTMRLLFNEGLQEREKRADKHMN